MKKFLIILIVVLLLGAAVGAYFIYDSNSSYIGKDAAGQAALADAGLNRAEVHEVEVDFEKTAYAAWYDVDFQTYQTEYEYSIDAVNSSVLASYSQPEHHDR